MFASRGFIHDDLLCTTMNKKHGEKYSSYTVDAMLPIKNKIIIWELEF